MTSSIRRAAAVALPFLLALACSSTALDAASKDLQDSREREDAQAPQDSLDPVAPPPPMVTALPEAPPDAGDACIA
jgi:hypothetical protein